MSSVPRVPRTHRARTPLSRERVLGAALEMADSAGIDSLTMRALGQALGVEAMSLYNYVEDKDDLLTGIVELVLSEIDLAPAAEDWRSDMRATAVSAHEALLRHPWATRLVLTPTSARMISVRMGYIESILARLRVAGFTPEAASRGYHALDSHILGFTIWQLGHALPADAPPDFIDTVMRQLDPDAFPYLMEHAGVHMKESEGEEEGEFEFGLDLILDGLERYVHSTATRSDLGAVTKPQRP
ncbi:MAG: TetR/AcrR family transcriptional regulator C-terminal domain-containing protein [Acidimicrobiales bacterium]